MNFEKCEKCGFPEVVHPYYERETKGCKEFKPKENKINSPEELIKHFQEESRKNPSIKFAVIKK